MSLVVACALSACDDEEPVPGGESGDEVVDDDDGGTSNGTSATSVTTTSASATTNSTTDPTTTTGPTPTTMDPSASQGDSSSDETTDGETTNDCPVGTQGCPCDGGACDGDLMCTGDVCVQDVDCGVDIYEDNNTEDESADLGTITDDDDDAVTITAVLEGDEVDWFTYAGDDSFLATVNPSRQLETTGALRMCKFAECVEGLFATEIECPKGTAAAESPEGRPGCCGDDTFEIELNCLGAVDDDAQIYMRFDQGLADCTQYTLEFHY